MPYDFECVFNCQLHSLTSKERSVGVHLKWSSAKKKRGGGVSLTSNKCELHESFGFRFDQSTFKLWKFLT